MKRADEHVFDWKRRICGMAPHLFDGWLASQVNALGISVCEKLLEDERRSADATLAELEQGDG